MRNSLISVVGILLFFVVVQGCSGESTGTKTKSYKYRLEMAEKLYDKAEKTFYEARSLGSEHEKYEGRMRTAYELGEKGTVILNELDDEFAGRKAPPGEVLAHKPLMSKMAKLMSEIVKAMPIGR